MVTKLWMEAATVMLTAVTWRALIAQLPSLTLRHATRPTQRSTAPTIGRWLRLPRRTSGDITMTCSDALPPTQYLKQGRNLEALNAQVQAAKTIYLYLYYFD